MNATRRSLLQAIPVLAASSAFAWDGPALSSFVKPYSELPVKQSGQNESRPIFDGVPTPGSTLKFTKPYLLREVSHIRRTGTSTRNFFC